MTLLAPNLRKCAEALGLSNAEVARRSGLTERTYGNYVLGRTEPNLDVLLNIAKVLGVSVDALLGSTDLPLPPDPFTERLMATARVLSPADLEVVLVQAEAIHALRQRQSRS